MRDLFEQYIATAISGELRALQVRLSPREAIAERAVAALP
jgi:hypothetical protein